MHDLNEFAYADCARSEPVTIHALNSERMAFLDQTTPGWLKLKAGDFDTLEGSADQGRRRVYFEFATKALNNYFPPRTGYGGLSEKEVASELSWFGVTQLYQYSSNQPPQDELGRFTPLFTETQSDLHASDSTARLAHLVNEAVVRWSQATADGECVRLINDAIGLKLLPNTLAADSKLAAAVQRYCAVNLSLLRLAELLWSEIPLRSEPVTIAACGVLSRS